MITEKYKQEVIEKLQDELEQAKNNGSTIQYWLENSNAFNALENKKCNLGDILILDVERKTCIVKLIFLEKGYWMDAKEDLKKSNELIREMMNKKENHKKISLVERIKIDSFFKKYMKRNNYSLEQIRKNLATEEKTLSLFDKRNQLSMEANILVDKFTEILNESQYKIIND
jgi:hypothetical protein